MLGDQNDGSGISSEICSSRSHRPLFGYVNRPRKQCRNRRSRSRQCRGVCPFPRVFAVRNRLRRCCERPRKRYAGLCVARRSRSGAFRARSCAGGRELATWKDRLVETGGLSAGHAFCDLLRGTALQWGGARCGAACAARASGQDDDWRGDWVDRRGVGSRFRLTCFVGQMT